jgi:hypothetical protein
MFYDFQRTNLKTLVSTMSFDEENVDNNFMGNIYNITLKLQTNSSNNSFSIRKIEPSKLHTFHFFL